MLTPEILKWVPQKIRKLKPLGPYPPKPHIRPPGPLDLAPIRTSGSRPLRGHKLGPRPFAKNHCQKC